MFDALLFDLDGTLIDTEQVSVSTGRAAFQSLGHEVATSFLHGLIGKDHGTCAQIIQGHVPGIDMKCLNTLWHQMFADETATHLPLKSGVQDLLAAMSHLPLALVTSSSRSEAHRKLKVAGIAAFFSEVISVDDVINAKPAPDPYLLAATRLGLPPQRCLVFEDSEVGAEAAHRAGCVVVQVPDVLPATGRWAHHVADDLMTGARLAGLRL